MKELSKDELLELLKSWRCDLSLFVKRTGKILSWNEKDEQAYEQIVALIKSHPNLNQNMAQSKGKVTEEFMEKWAKDLTGFVRDELPIDTDLVKELLKEAGYQVRAEVTEEWIEEKAKGVIKKSFKDYETELQAILFVDPIRKSSYRKINKATDALGEQIWGFIRSLVKEIHGRK